MAKRLMPDIYHDLIMPEETQRIREEVRQFVNDEVMPVAHDIGAREEDKKNFPWELINKMAKRGMFGIPFPKEYGGRGLEYPVSATVVTMEELAYASDSVAAIFDVQCMLSGNAISYGSDFVKSKYLHRSQRARPSAALQRPSPTQAPTFLSVRLRPPPKSPVSSG